MGVMERRQRDKENQQRRILDAARELIRTDGIENLTIRRLAQAIEYSPMSLYNHFTDKDAILHALAREAFAALGEALPKATGDPVRTLKRALLQYIEFGIAHPNDYQLLFMTRRKGESIQATRMKGLDAIPDSTGGRDAFSLLVSYVERCHQNEAKGDTFTIATVLWCGIHGVVALLLTQTSFPFGPPQLLAKKMIDVLVKGSLEAS